MAHLSIIFIGSFIAYLGIIVAINHPQGLQKKTSWTYVPLSIYSNSSDEAKLKIDLRIERVSRGVFAVSGFAVLSEEITEAAMFEGIIYWSATSNMDYKRMSIGIEKDSLINTMKSYYKDFIMESLASCSNMPQYGKEITTVLEPKRYEAKNCMISTEQLPNHIQPGFYKIEFIGSGQLSWYLLFTIQVEASS